VCRQSQLQKIVAIDGTPKTGHSNGSNRKQSPKIKKKIKNLKRSEVAATFVLIIFDGIATHIKQRSFLQ
jgi:hypothetical protein